MENLQDAAKKREIALKKAWNDYREATKEVQPKDDPRTLVMPHPEHPAYIHEAGKEYNQATELAWAEYHEVERAIEMPLFHELVEQARKYVEEGESIEFAAQVTLPIVCHRLLTIALEDMEKFTMTLRPVTNLRAYLNASPYDLIAENIYEAVVEELRKG